MTLQEKKGPVADAVVAWLLAQSDRFDYKLPAHA